MGNIQTTNSVSVSSYQMMDGSNFTVAGFEQKLSRPDGSVALFIGGGTDFTKDATSVVDLKGTYNYDKNGIFNQNARLRTKLGLKSCTTQIRYSPLSVNVPVGKSTSVYINPHYSGQFDFVNNKWSNSAGVFAGVTQNIGGHVSVSVEAQRYNLQNIKDNGSQNWGVNGIIAYKF